MASTQQYIPAEPSVPKTFTDEVTLPPPLQKDPDQKTPIMQRIMAIGMPVLMVVMMVIMFKVMGRGGARSVMMMMMMGMMMVTTLGQTLSQAFGGGSQADNVNADRQNYFLTLQKSREKAHEVGRSQQRVQTYLYPNPRVLLTLITSRHRTLWAARPSEDDSDLMFDHDDMMASADSDQSADTWLKARVGTGLIALSPGITVEDADSVAPELLEPVTHQGFVNFKTAQSVVPNSPLPVSMDRPSVGMRGDESTRRDFVRAMLVSLAYNHSPANVMIGVVSSSDKRSEWEWMKWLPHTHNRFEKPVGDAFPMLVWSSVEEAYSYLSAHRDVISALRGRVVVVVDTPGATLRPPLGYTIIPGVTFLVVDSADDSRLVEKEDLFHLSEEGRFSAYNMIDIADADFVDVSLAESIARAMSSIRPPGFVHIEVENAGEAGKAAVKEVPPPHLLDVIGTRDLESYDLKAQWRETDTQKSFKVPIGFQVARDGRSSEYVPTGELAYLDILQKASGGTGPHGLFQGGTGTGKSFLIVMVILMLCLKYSPRRLMIIAADFKGGATFNPLQHLPHFIVNLTNLEGSLDMVDRTQAMLEGEHQRRQQLFAKYDVPDIFDYRKLQAKKSAEGVEMEDVPDLLFVADEFRAFITKNPQYKDMFGMIAAEGRSTGIHLLIGSQSINHQMLGDALPNFDYGISLKVKDSSDSNTVIRTPQATALPPSQVAILFYQDLQDELHTYFKGFNHSLPYVREHLTGDAPVIEHVESEDKDTDLEDTGISVFTMETAGVIAPREEKEEDTSPVPDTRNVVTEETGKDLLSAIIDMVSEKSAGYTKTRTYWMPALSVPKALGEVPDEEIAAEQSSNISVRIGDIDTPRNHTRIPLNVEFGTSSTGNLAIVGSSGSGRSTAIRTMVASSARRYYGGYVSWLLYDYKGSALSAVSKYPNVSLYGTRNNPDTWRRIEGEVRRVLAIRERAFEEYGYSSAYDYITRRGEDGVVGDPFAWLMVAIDGFSDMAEDYKADMDEQTELIRLMKKCAGYGIYFVASVESMVSLSARYEPVFSQGLRLYVADTSSTFGSAAGRQTNMRDILSQVPQSEPGRVADGSITNDMGQPVFHHARVFLPIENKPEPAEVKESGPVYNNKQDRTPEVVALGEKLMSVPDLVDNRAPVLEMVTRIDADALFESLPMDTLRELPQAFRPLPYGLDAATYLPRMADPGDPAAMNHIIVSGTSGSGRTTTLRTFMRAVTEVHPPSDARFFMLDTTGALVNDFMHYKERGYMKQNAYIMSKDKVSSLLKVITQLAQQRAPDEKSIMENPGMLRDRTYFTGPEIYVFVDNAENFLTNGYTKGDLEKAIEALPSYDIGVRFIINVQGSNLPTTVSSNKGILSLVDNHNPLFLLHNGAANVGAIITGTKTRFTELPAGRVQLFNRQAFNSKNVPRVQVAFTPEPADSR